MKKVSILEAFRQRVYNLSDKIKIENVTDIEGINSFITDFSIFAKSTDKVAFDAGKELACVNIDAAQKDLEEFKKVQKLFKSPEAQKFFRSPVNNALIHLFFNLDSLVNNNKSDEFQINLALTVRQCYEIRILLEEKIY